MAQQDTATEPDKPGVIDRMRARYPWFDHVMRAQQRYQASKGDFYAAGITYFTVFALFPLLMVGFAVGGFILVRQPDLLAQVEDRIRSSVTGDVGNQLVDLMESAIASRTSVGIIGLIDPSHYNSIASSSLEGLAFMDAALTANHYIGELRAEGVDVVILLAMVPGWTNADGTASGNLIDLAYAVPGADAIVGSLHNEVATVVDGTPVVLAWRYGEKLGHITLAYDTSNRRVVSSSVELIDVIGNPLKLEADTAIATMLDGYVQLLKEANTKVIGTVDKDLARGSGETAIGNWIVDAMNESAHSQIAFTNPGGIRADLKAGPITGNDIYAVCPFPNTICTTTMQGEQLLRFLEQCATIAPIPISGLKFGFDKNRSEGSRLIFAELMDGTPIQKDQMYAVTTNSFLKDGKDGYTVLGENTGWVDTSVLMRDAMTQYVQKYGTIRTVLDGRIVNLTK